MPGLLSCALVAASAAVTALLRSRLGLRAALMVGCAGSFVVASAVGLALLDARQLLPLPLTLASFSALGLLVLAAALGRRWLPAAPDEPSGPPPPGPWPWLGLGVVLIGVLLRLGPSPYLHGGQDQGIYVNVGHHMARTGRLRPIDRAMAGALRGVRQADILAAHRIEAQPPGSPLEGVREGRWIAGLHVEDASEGRLMPGFFHLLPTWFAMAEHDWGFARSTWPLVYFWLLSALAALGLGQRLARALLGDEAPPAHTWGAGILAAAGLALHPLDLWISTFTVTENLARACLLGAALLAIEGFERERQGQAGATMLAALAGLVFAAAAFTRGSFVAHAIALAGALVLLPRCADAPPRARGPGARRALLWAMVAGTTLAVVQAVLHSWPYFFSAASNHFHVPRIRPFQTEAVAWTLAAGAAVVLVDLALRPLVDHPRVAPRLNHLLRLGAALMLLGAALATVGHVTFFDNEWGPQQQVTTILVRHGGPVALALGLISMAAATRKAPDAALPWVWIGAAILLTTGLKAGIRYEFYYARYLVADAVPVLSVAAAVLVAWLGARGLARAPRVSPRALALVLALAWLLPPLHVLRRPVYWTRDLHDTPAQLHELFGHVPEDALLFFDARAPHRWRGILATPALLSFAKNVLVYPSNRLIEHAIKGGTEVYFISGGWEPQDAQRWPSPEHGPFRTQVVARGTYLAERAEIVEGGMPRELVDWGGPWEVQRVDPSIWRGSGAFTLHRGSAFITVTDTGLETAEIAMRWVEGARVELALGVEPPCDYEVELVREGRAAPLAPLPADRPMLRYFAMPAPPPDLDHIASEGVPASIRVRAQCPQAAPLWTHLSMRWER